MSQSALEEINDREGAEAQVRSSGPARVRPVVGFTLVLAVMASLHGYIGWRLIRGSGIQGGWAFVCWALLWTLLAAIPLGIFSRSLRPRRLGTLVKWVSFCWIGIFGLLLTAVVLTDLLRWILSVGGTSNAAARLLYGQIQAAAIVCLVLPTIGIGVWTARGPARIERLTIPLARLGRGLQGLRIVQITDIHAGPTLSGRFVKRIVEQVNQLQPDVVAITGDLVDGSVRDLKDDIASLAGLRAREGVYFVTGNHEYYSGADAWVAELRRLGITVLHNEHRIIERGGARLVLGGVTDYHGGQFSAMHESRPDLAFANAPDGIPRILLAHQPRSAAGAAQQRVDLQLSGHTHGGQIFPFMFFVRLQQPAIRGLRKLHGIWVYISRGTGYWGPPMRVGSPPEITVITLASKSAESITEARAQA